MLDIIHIWYYSLLAYYLKLNKNTSIKVKVQLSIYIQSVIQIFQFNFCYNNQSNNINK